MKECDIILNVYMGTVAQSLRRIFMKALKKVIAISLALMLAGIALVAPVAAATEVPLVVVQGFAAIPLVKNQGQENEMVVFPPENITSDGMIADLITTFLTGFIDFGTNKGDWTAFGNKIVNYAKKIVDPVAYNTDGTPMYDNVTHETYNEPMSSYTEEEIKSIFTPIGMKYAEQYNPDLVYSFGYDWRESPIDCAADLNDFINYVKAKTGSAKVNIVAISQGSAVTLSYMATYGGASLNNVVFASPAWQGTSIAGDLFTGKIDVDIYAFENFMVSLSDGSATTHIVSVFISSLATSEGFTEEWFPILEDALQGTVPQLYSDVIIPMMAGMPGLWCLVPGEYFEAAKAYLFPEGMDAALEAKVNAYNEIQSNAQNIVKSCENDGMKFGIVCGYNRQIAPVNENLNTSDMVVDTKYASGGATCAQYLSSFEDWGNNYAQAIECGHYHVSWDSRIDASTCMFPEQTWFIKNLSHVAYGTYEDDGTCDIIMWLLSMKKQHTISTDKENYPQFNLYNTYKRTTTPMNVTDRKMGDVNDDNRITTADARDALKIAAGLVKMPEEAEQLIIDVNEDGEINSVDARCILCMACGIDVDFEELY